ncbi:hypothetical protein As57867_016689, partial [Aphanomyces stellatus]
MAATAFISLHLVTTLPTRAGTNMRRMDPEVLQQVDNIVTGILVVATHRSNMKKYKITGLTSTSASSTYFDGADGNKCSVADYFEQKYTPLKYPEWP